MCNLMIVSVLTDCQPSTRFQSIVSLIKGIQDYLVILLPPPPATHAHSPLSHRATDTHLPFYFVSLCSPILEIFVFL